MALYFDDPPILAPSLFALNQIANGHGQIGGTSATLGGHNVFKLTFDTHPPPGFGYLRLQQIANTPSDVVLSSQSGNYILPNGTLLAKVQVALIHSTFEIVVWDKTDCNFSGYHVFDIQHYPIRNPPFLAVFQELIYAYYSAASGATNGTLDPLVKAETNMLRAELGLPLRDPANQGGGCGHGFIPWSQIIADMVAAVYQSVPRLRPEVVVASLRDALSDSDHLVTRALIDSPFLRNAVDVVLLGTLRSYYQAAALILDKGSVSGDLPQQLGHLIETLPNKAAESETIDILANTSQDPNKELDTLNIFIGDPYKVMRRARAQLVTGRSITEVSDELRNSVALWSKRVSQWEPQVTTGRESVAGSGGRSNLSFHVSGPHVAAEPNF